MLSRRGSLLSYILVFAGGVVGTVYLQQMFQVPTSICRPEDTLPDARVQKELIKSLQNIEDLGDIINQMKRTEEKMIQHIEEVNHSENKGPRELTSSFDKETTPPEDPDASTNAQISQDTNMPMVYMYQDGSLQLVQNFCKWTPGYLCAAMTTETGPMPVYVHNIINRNDTLTVSGALLNKGVWEKKIVEVFLRELKKFPDAGVLDLGCKSVVKNELTKQVVMVVNALYEDHRTVVFDTSKTTTYELSRIRLRQLRKGKSVCEETSRVQTIMMDDLLPVIKFKTAIMKIDVESFEYFAISGGKKLLEEIDVKAILMEWFHVARTNKGKMLMDMLTNYNYIPYSIPQSGPGKELDPTKYRKWTHDVLFLKS